MDQTIQKLFSPHKGILANDASVASLTKRLNKYGIEATEQNRNAFRKIFYTTPGVGKYISGVILNEEAMQCTPLLAQQGIIPGVKVDKGLMAFGIDGKEFMTTGSKDLDFRLQDHKSEGARFAKWRAAFVISSNTPTETAINENIRQLVDYAKICIANEIVPIVEPEVLMDGDHSLEQTVQTTTKILSRLFEQLKQEGIPIEKVILKTNMVLPGSLHTPASAAEVGKATIEMLSLVVPKNIGGVVFLSGGQTGEQAIENLRSIIAYSRTTSYQLPTTFSFERVFEEPVIQVWSKNMDDVEGAQKAFLDVARRISEVLLFTSSRGSEE